MILYNIENFTFYKNIENGEVRMNHKISVLIIFVAFLFILSCSCPYCDKLEYMSAQTTIETEVQKKAQELNNISSPNREDITATLTAILSENPRIFGAAYATVPYDENISLIEIYYVFREGDKTETKHDKAYNFMTSPNNNWYKKPYLHKKAMWSIPYYDVNGSGEKYYLTTYSYPIIENSEVKFMFTADYLLNIKE